jgi:hypothetical protein
MYIYIYADTLDLKVHLYSANWIHTHTHTHTHTHIYNTYIHIHICRYVGHAGPLHASLKGYVIYS